MKRVFNRFPVQDRGSSVVDWAVLMAGVVVLTFSVATAVTEPTDRISGDALDHATSGADQLPS